MPKSEVSDDFEFIETPAAPTPLPPPEDYGVRTTTVSSNDSNGSTYAIQAVQAVSDGSKAHGDYIVPINQECASARRCSEQ